MIYMEELWPVLLFQLSVLHFMLVTQHRNMQMLLFCNIPSQKWEFGSIGYFLPNVLSSCFMKNPYHYKYPYHYKPDFV